MTLHMQRTALPTIQLVEHEADIISDLAWAARDRFPDVCEQLLEEVDRARLCAQVDLPEDVVAMGSDVTYRDARSGAVRQVRLVYPLQADVAQGHISILTPIGAALIGMRVGAAILWPDRDGELRDIIIDAVAQAREV